MVAGAGGRAHAVAAKIVAKQEFAAAQAIAMRSLLIAPEASAPRVVLGDLALKAANLGNFDLITRTFQGKR